MIVKLPKKDIIALIYITVLTAVALWYGFTSVPSPEKQRDMTYDQTRMNNINAIQLAIDDYYTQNTILPAHLDDLPTNSFVSAKDLMDPQTKQPYEYTKLSETEYNVCATFATDSTEQKDTKRNMYYSDFDKLNHPQGNYCFPKNVVPNSSIDLENDISRPRGSDSAEQSTGSNGVG